MVFAGGSSSILRSALAPDVSSSSTVSMTTTRHCDIAGVMPMNSPSARTCSTMILLPQPLAFLLGQALEPAHVGVAAGLDQPDHRVIVGGIDPGQVAWRPRAVGQHAPRGGVGEGRLSDPLGPREQPRVVKLARFSRPRRTGRPRGPGRRSWKQVRDGVEQALGHFLAASRSVDQAHALAAHRRRCCGMRPRPCGDTRRSVRRSRRWRHCRGPPPGWRRRRAEARASGRAMRSPVAKALIARTASMPRPPAPP